MLSSIFLPIVPRQGVAQVTPPWVARKNKKLPSCDYQILGRYLSAYLCKTMISLLLLNNSPDSYSQGGSSISHNSTKVTKQACPTRTMTFGRTGMDTTGDYKTHTRPAAKPCFICETQTCSSYTHATAANDCSKARRSFGIQLHF